MMQMMFTKLKSSVHIGKRQLIKPMPSVAALHLTMRSFKSVVPSTPALGLLHTRRFASQSKTDEEEKHAQTRREME